MLNDNYRIVTSKVQEQYAGVKLLAYLTDRFPYKDSSEWTLILQDQRMLVNGSAGNADLLLSESDTLEYFHENHAEPEVDLNYHVITQNENYMVIDKPGNLPVHPAGKFFNNTLWKILKNKGLEPHFINRLDRETSGVMIVALNKSTASKLGKQMQRRGIHKEYMVLVEGNFPEHVVAGGYLLKDEQSEIKKKLKFTYDDNPEQYGKNGAETEFDLIESKNGLSLLKCVIKTGRTHQIRATLCSLGFPVVGDKIYGVDESLYLKFAKGCLTDQDMKTLRMDHQALHSHKINLTDPETLAELEFVSPVPEVFTRVLYNL